MAYDFDRGLQRLNTAVAGCLTNADALLDGQPLRIVFDNGGADALGIEVRRPRAALPSAAAAAVTDGSLLVVAGQGTYRVLQATPDGLGLTALELQLAA